MLADLGCCVVSIPDPEMWDVVSCLLLVLVPMLGFELVFLLASFELLACARAVGCCFLCDLLFIRWFLFRADAPFLCFRGGAVRFSFVLVAFGCLFFLGWFRAFPFW